jgi:hypothetical protein
MKYNESLFRAIEHFVAVDRIMGENSLRSDLKQDDETSFSAIVYPEKSPFLLEWSIYEHEKQWGFDLHVGVRGETEIRITYDAEGWKQIITHPNQRLQGASPEEKLLNEIERTPILPLPDDAYAYILIVKTVTSFLEIFKTRELKNKDRLH